MKDGIERENLKTRNAYTSTHWYYTEVLKFHEQAQANNHDYGYNYGHFTIADNLSISDEKLRKILTTYERGTVWYERDIKGLRKTAEGIVFEDFANYTQRYVVQKSSLTGFKWVGIGFDIGGNNSAYAMTCSAMGYDNVLYILSSRKKQAPELPMSEVGNFVFDFINKVEEKYKIRINRVSCDHSDVIINTLNKERRIFRKTYKPPLEDRPFLFSTLMAQGRFKIVDSECEDLINELQSLVYDQKNEKPIVLDDGSMQIDTWDSLTYSVAANWRYLNGR